MKIGGIAGIIGLAGAVVVGLLQGLELFSAPAIVSTILVIAGLVIGGLNITRKEATPFMVASLVLGVGSGVLSVLPFFGNVLDSILTALASVSIPAGIVVAVNVVLGRGRN